MAAKYPPYINAYGTIPKLFNKIKTAAVPPKFTYDFLKTVLGLKSSSAQATVPLLKRLGFLDQASVPTQAYKDFRSPTKSGAIMAKRIKEAYKDIYQSAEYAHKLEPKELKDNLVTVLGVEKTDPNVGAAVSTFGELVKLADFDKILETGGSEDSHEEDTETPNQKPPRNPIPVNTDRLKLGISYTINLNLPATTDIQVFNAIFKSLRETILDSD